MSDEEVLQAFVQSVYLARYGRYLDDITDEDGVAEIAKTIDWTNQFLDELEEEADWQYVRENDKEIGTIASATDTFNLPEDARKLAVDENRPLVIMQDGSIVSEWDVVDPKNITERSSSVNQKRVTFVNNKIVFSRALNDQEIGGTVVADVINSIPRLAEDDVDILELVKPKQLLILGVAKNATLPDIVGGGLSPSFAQKYSDLLDKAKMENDAAAVAVTAIRDDYSHIGGVY